MLRQKDSLFNFFPLSFHVVDYGRRESTFQSSQLLKRARRQSNFSVFEKLNKNTKVNCFHCSVLYESISFSTTAGSKLKRAALQTGQLLTCKRNTRAGKETMFFKAHWKSLKSSQNLYISYRLCLEIMIAFFSKTDDG